ncbi:MAG: uroporphyrinogen-III C-methyltransferase [Gammaproteobacteria bacterium]|nr:uroporphyrinogen-III C-methyltransferase [Gammaproteobacteria bacterium]
MSSTDQPAKPSTDNALAETNANSSEKKPEPKADKKKSTDQKTQKPATKNRSGLFLLFIIVLLASSAGAYFFWQQQLTIKKLSANNDFQNRKLTKVADKLEQTRKNLYEQQQLITQLTEASKQLSSNFLSLADSQQTLVKTTENVFNITHRNQKQWLLSEVSYLLSLANQRLLVSRDIKTAVAALKAANNRLHDLADPGLLNLRKTIADEVAQLNLLTQPDINGIAFSLDNISVMVTQLPFKTAQQKHIEKTQRTEKVELASLDQESFLSPVWERLKTLVSIKKHSRDIRATETVIEKADIDNQLRYRIEASRLALINQNTKIFNHEIKSALTLISTYYDQNDNRVATLLTELTSLSTLNLLPELPDITGSWLKLQKFIAIADARDGLNKNKGKSIK